VVLMVLYLWLLFKTCEVEADCGSFCIVYLTLLLVSLFEVTASLTRDNGHVLHVSTVGTYSNGHVLYVSTVGTYSNNLISLHFTF
jgi:hypothetical protein